MNSAELRSMVQEVLLEELAALQSANGDTTSPASAPKSVTDVAEHSLPGQSPTEPCWVPMRAENDLALFARRVLQLAEDPRRRQAIEGGVFPFRFEQSTSDGLSNGVNPGIGSTALESRIDKGLVNEKHINKLLKGTTILNLGKRATITPLARDKARKMGITITKET
jgi:hypothetical protein